MIRALDKWLIPYLLRPRVRREAEKPVELLISVCDHFEPLHHTDKSGAMLRVERWAREFPKLADEFADSEGVSPKHTFFYPTEQYDGDILSGIAAICEKTSSETEVHLHHENDSVTSLTEKLEKGKADFAKHGLLPESEDGQKRYGFIHGNWALDNSLPSGGHCGVSGELRVLRETGCYADFTLPSAPSPAQTRTINRIYYAQSTDSPKSHDSGISAEAGTTKRGEPDQLLLIQGPLGLNWGWRKAGVIPRIENADLTLANPPTESRLKVWLKMGIHVKGHPQVVFAKLHTHGALPRNSDALLGDPMRKFHHSLDQLAKRDPFFRYHYVTAREMANIVHALEDSQPGETPPFAKARNHAILPAPVNKMRD